MAETNVPALPETARAFDSFLSLEFGRQVGLMVGLAASVALGVGLALWLIMEKDFTPLYDNLDNIDGSAVIALLESKQIETRIDRRSGALLVDSAKIHQARMEVSAAGMPVDSTVGFELLEQEQPLGTSQFMENARYRRSLEGELSRTISSIASVRSARVHLAIPKNRVFVREASTPRASVFLETFQGLGVGEQQVRAIANLVASSIPEMSIANVTVVDQRGNLLSNFDEQDILAGADKQLQYQKTLETNLLQRVNSLLEPILGSDLFRAEVAVDLDFTQASQTSEIFNPDLPAVRSEQRTTEQTVDVAADGAAVPGALNNQLDGEVEGAEGGQNTGQPSRSRVLETRNFELDRTISHTRQQIGAVRKITVAVAIDDKPTIATNSPSEAGDGAEATPEPTANPWTQQELDQLVVLVQNAIGYDATRGDRVSVVNTAFFRPVQENVENYSLAIWEQPIFWTALKIAGGMLAFVIVVFMVLRPAMTGLTENSRRLRDLEHKHKQALLAVEEMQKGAEAKIEEDGTISLTPALISSEPSQLDQQISMVQELVDKDPDRVAQVIQGWTGTDE